MNKYIETKKDDRGEVAMLFDLNEKGEVIFLSIYPGKIRGNHYHKEKRELFCVVEGNAKFRIRNVKTGESKEYELSGDKLEIIEILPWWTHSVENVGKSDVKCIEWGNKPYNSISPDSFAEIV